MAWFGRLLLTAALAVWIGHALRDALAVPGAQASSGTSEAVAALRGAGLHVTPVTLPRLAADPWSLEQGSGGTHLRLRLNGVSRPGLLAANVDSPQASIISADLYLSTWMVVPERGRSMLLVEIRITDPLGGEPLWSKAFLTPADSLEQLEGALQQAISEALQRSVDRRRELITV